MQSKEYEFGGYKYTIFEDGRIYSQTGKLLKQRPNSDGYAVVTMGNKKVQRTVKHVHRMVAELFIPNPNNLSDVDHLDGNRMNPRKDNLEWTSHEENVRRTIERGNKDGLFVGEKNPRAKLTSEIVLLLREKFRNGVTVQELVNQFGYPWSTINNAVKYLTWKNLP